MAWGRSASEQGTLVAANTPPVVNTPASTTATTTPAALAQAAQATQAKAALARGPVKTTGGAVSTASKDLSASPDTTGRATLLGGTG